MPQSDKTRKLLDHIGNELKLLWPQLDAYQELFVVEQEKRRLLLQSTAPGFFSIVQVSLAESILMRVFRLMDPDKGRGGENSSFQNLHKALRIGVAESQPLRDAIKKLQVDWKCAEGPYAALLALRNKLLAHNDFVKRSALPTNQLGMNISEPDFASAWALACRLWELYQQVRRALGRLYAVSCGTQQSHLAACAGANG